MSWGAPCCQSAGRRARVPRPALFFGTPHKATCIRSGREPNEAAEATKPSELFAASRRRKSPRSSAGPAGTRRPTHECSHIVNTEIGRTHPAGGRSALGPQPCPHFTGTRVGFLQRQESCAQAGREFAIVEIVPRAGLCGLGSLRPLPDCRASRVRPFTSSASSGSLRRVSQGAGCRTG